MLFIDIYTHGYFRYLTPPDFFHFHSFCIILLYLLLKLLSAVHIYWFLIQPYLFIIWMLSVILYCHYTENIITCLSNLALIMVIALKSLLGILFSFNLLHNYSVQLTFIILSYLLPLGNIVLCNYNFFIHMTADIYFLISTAFTHSSSNF